MCDSKGVIYKGSENIDQFKSAFAVDTKLRSLDEAMKNADVFLGLSAKNVVSKGAASKDGIACNHGRPGDQVNPQSAHYL